MSEIENLLEKLRDDRLRQSRIIMLKKMAEFHRSEIERSSAGSKGAATIPQKRIFDSIREQNNTFLESVLKRIEELSTTESEITGIQSSS